MKIAVSYLSSDYKPQETIKLIDKSTADYIHVDLMDGKFVENKNFTIGEVTKLLGQTIKPLDIHLMTINPEKYFEALAMLNTEYLTFHVEVSKKPLEVIDKIKNLGIKVGISINPETDIEDIKMYLQLVDQVLVMSVHPGKGGQTFIPEVIQKIDKLIEIRKNNNLSFVINVDGGINSETIKLLNEKEIDMIVSGSFICHSNNFNERIAKLKG